MDLELVLRRAVELGASDIHLKVERPPIMRCDGHLGELEGESELTERDLELALEEVCAETPKRLQTFLETGEYRWRRVQRRVGARVRDPSAASPIGRLRLQL